MLALLHSSESACATARAEGLHPGNCWLLLLVLKGANAAQLQSSKRAEGAQHGVTSGG
jgi:hypothetical protein